MRERENWFLVKSGEVKRVCGCARKYNGRRNVRGKWIREKEVRWSSRGIKC